VERKKKENERCYGVDVTMQKEERKKPKKKRKKKKYTVI
jgi:hypothetical protein